jgi:hypothetical protein
MLVNLQQVIRGHDTFLAKHHRLVQEAAETAARHAVDHVQRYPEFKPRTGALQRATKAKVVKTRGGKLIRITNNKPYAPTIDGGSKAHIIAPKRVFSGGVMVQKRGFLRFRGRDGRWVFARRVRHPGTKPYKFGYRAAHSAHRVLGEHLRRRMTETAKQF